MDTIKKGIKFIIILYLFYVLSNICILVLLKSQYQNKKVDINQKDFKIEIFESKATISNGYIKGRILNNSGKDLDGYLRVEFFSKKNNLLGTRYIEIKNLKFSQNQEIEFKYRVDNVNNIKINYINRKDKKIEKIIPDNLLNIKKRKLTKKELGIIFLGLMFLA